MQVRKKGHNHSNTSKSDNYSGTAAPIKMTAGSSVGGSGGRRRRSRLALVALLVGILVLEQQRQGGGLVAAARLFCEPPGRYWVTSGCYELLGVSRRAANKEIK